MSPRALRGQSHVTEGLAGLLCSRGDRAAVAAGALSLEGGSYAGESVCGLSSPLGSLGPLLSVVHFALFVFSAISCLFSALSCSRFQFVGKVII